MVLTTPNVLHVIARLSYLLAGQRSLRAGLINEIQTLKRETNGEYSHGYAFLIDYFRLRYLGCLVWVGSKFLSIDTARALSLLVGRRRYCFCPRTYLSGCPSGGAGERVKNVFRSSLFLMKYSDMCFPQPSFLARGRSSWQKSLPRHENGFIVRALSSPGDRDLEQPRCAIVSLIHHPSTNTGWGSGIPRLA